VCKDPGMPLTQEYQFVGDWAYGILIHLKCVSSSDLSPDIYYTLQLSTLTVPMSIPDFSNVVICF